MITSEPSELELFQVFLGRELAAKQPPENLQTAVERFREYQAELQGLREKLRLAEEQSARGESAPFDAAATKYALNQRLSGNG